MGPIRLQLRGILYATRAFMVARALWVILLLMLLAQSYHIDYPYIDHHGFRQSDTANMARGFYEHGFNILHPEAAEFGQGNGAYEVEFQLMSFMVALLYVPLGVQEWVAHSVAMAFSVVFILFVYLVSALHYSRRVALLSAFFAAFMPLTIFFGRAMMPDSAMIAFSAGSIYFASRYATSGRQMNLLCAALCISGASLLKVTSLYLLAPVGFLALTTNGFRQTFRSPWTWASLAIVIVPSVLWYGYAHFVILETWSLGFGIWEFSRRSATAEIISDPSFYARVWDHVFYLIFGPAGVVLFLVGLLVSIRRRLNLVFIVWLVAILIYLVGVAERLYSHDYYLLPLVPVGSILMALGTWTVFDLLKDRIVRRVHQNDPRPHGTLSKLRGGLARTLTTCGPRVFAVTVVLIFLASSFLGLAYVRHGGILWGGGRIEQYSAGRVVDLLAPRGSRVVVEFGQEHKPTLIYYAHRDTYFLTVPFQAQALEDLRSKGAVFFVSTDMEQYRENLDFMLYMRSRYAMITDGFSYFAFNLSASPQETLPARSGTLNSRSENITFGGVVRLENVTYTSIPLASGDILSFGLRWRFTSLPEQDYLVGVKCVQGTRVLWGWDHTLGVGWAPWASVRLGDVIQENLTFVIPPDAEPGGCSLTVEVGWPSLLTPSGSGSKDFAGRPILARLEVNSSKLTLLDRLLKPVFYRPS